MREAQARSRCKRSNTKRLVAVWLGVVFLAGCVGTGAGGRRAWPILAAGGLTEHDTEKDEIVTLVAAETRPAPPQVLQRWQQELEDAAVNRQPLFTPVPLPGQAQQERWRCQVGWRCYATDPETRQRAELLSSGTAWRAESSSRTWVCGQARTKALEADCQEGIPHYEELEVDRDCTCTRE